MKRKAWFWIIGVIAILVIALAAAIWMQLLWIRPCDSGRTIIDIWYAASKSEHGGYAYRKLALKHSLAKFSKIKKGMGYEEIFKLAGCPTSPSISSVPSWEYYQLGDDWFMGLMLRDMRIKDVNSGLIFELEHDEYSAAPSPQSAIGAGTLAGWRGNKPKHRLAKFSKIKLGMSPAELFKLAGKPTDSVGTEVIWHRYKLDKGWYIHYRFLNEKLIDMCIVDYPNNREFELEWDVRSLHLEHVLAAAPSGGGTAGTFTDKRDGKVYRTVTIGGQTWMAENLNFATDSSVCYANDEDNCREYGRLYNWDDAMHACPAGWRVPSGDEWADLAVAVAGRRSNGNINWKIAGARLKSTTGWSDDQCSTEDEIKSTGCIKGERYSGNGTDDFGFSALPGGDRYWDSFFSRGSSGYWWSATEKDGNMGVEIWALYDSDTEIKWWNHHKKSLKSLRCVEGAAGLRQR